MEYLASLMGITTILMRPSTTLYHGSFRGGTHGNAVAIVKLFKNELWTAMRTISILRYLKMFSGDIPAAGGGVPSAPGALSA